MEHWVLLWHIPTVMLVMLAAGLIMGQRHVGELSVFDLLTGISIGAVAGAGIIDPTIPHLTVLAAILGLALFHYMVTWVIKKSVPVGRMATFEPLVVVKDGKPLRSAMSRVHLTLSDLLPLLREKDIFDLREVRVAVLEPDGKVTVIKQGGSFHGAVIVDGHVEHEVLQGLGWSRERLLAELARQGQTDPTRIFVATLSESGELFVVPKGDEPLVPTVRH